MQKLIISVVHLLVQQRSRAKLLQATVSGFTTKTTFDITRTPSKIWVWPPKLVCRFVFRYYLKKSWLKCRMSISATRNPEKTAPKHHFAAWKTLCFVPKQALSWNPVEVPAMVNHQLLESQLCEKNYDIDGNTRILDDRLPGSPGMLAFGTMLLSGNRIWRTILVLRQTRTSENQIPPKSHCSHRTIA